MINVVYLVLVFTTSNGLAVEKIPQANMAQCQVNAKNYRNIPRVRGTYCIVGAK